VRRQRGAGLATQLREYVSFTAWAAAKLMVLDQRVRYDVVQVHNVPDFIVFAALPAKVRGARVVLDLHDLMPEFYASRFGGRMDSLPVRLVRWQERLSALLADRVITVTDLWRQALLGRGFGANRVHVVMTLPDEELYAARAPRAGGAGAVTVIYHGTLTYRYGVDLLVRALALARERVPLRAIVHGRGELAEELRRLIDELGLADSVRLSTTPLPATELAEMIASADIGVVPNRNDIFTDGILPTILLVYAALGVPAVVARSSATTTYFADDMVRYVEPGNVPAMADAIVALAQDPDGRRTMAVRAQAFTAAHPWASEADRYVTMVEELAGRGRSAPHAGKRATSLNEHQLP
jgi:glycosyltransferase involved in cell wall biosynthesis